MDFNISYSAYSLYKQSQLQFYFQYIAKAKPTNKAHMVYANAGNVVHKSIEKWCGNYAYSNKDFEALWLDEKIHEQFGFGGTKLSFEKYLQMFDRAKYVLRSVNFKDKNPVSEMEFKFEFHGESIKAIMDMVLWNENKYEVFDWKTDSAFTFDKHKDQRLFYSWVIYKTYGKIPKCTWQYLAVNDFVVDTCELIEIMNFEKDLIAFIDELKNKGTNIDLFEPGDWKGPFNVYAELCAQELERRRSKENIKVKFIQRGNYIFIENAPEELLSGLDLANKFDLPNKYFMQEAVKKKAKGFVNTEDVGTVHLFNPKLKCFPVGLHKKITEIIIEYENFYNKKVEIEFIDHRDQSIMDFKTTIIPQNTWNLRDYQRTASRIFENHKFGIIQIPTGGGKTITAVDIIYRLNARTLWIIDRKELLKQTKDTLVHFFGEENVGEISGKTRDIRPITIATIQTLYAKRNEGWLQDYFYVVNFMIVDEFHKAAAESYQSVMAKLPNTKYRLGLSATPTRDDGKEPILYSQLGEIIFKISEERLMSLGYLVKPTINFIRCNGQSLNMFKTPYADDYRESIINNKERNDAILTLIKQNVNKKILVLTKQVDHAQMLMGKLIYAYHIHGNTDKNIREKHMEDFKKLKSGVLFITLSIGAEGLDIPDLDVVINASANLGNIKSTQVLGRVLRSFAGKKEALYYDFIDNGYHTYAHSQQRIKHFEKLGYKVDVE